MLATGSKAPAFTLPDLNGSPHTLSQILASGPVLLALYKISCPTCQFALPFLDRLRNSSLQIVAISQDDASATRRFQTRFGVSMLTLLDREEDHYPVSNAFGITHVPALFLIEPDGIVSLSAEGFLKTDLEAIAARAGVPLFRADEAVPAWKAG
jgi:peroxiredoxin